MKSHKAATEEVCREATVTDNDRADVMYCTDLDLRVGIEPGSGKMTEIVLIAIAPRHYITLH